MTRKSQKSEERYNLEHFLQNKFGSVEYRILKDDEKPDFIIDLHNKKIGVELTNLYKSNGSLTISESSQIGKRLDVLNNAQKLYFRRNLKKYEFHFNFDLNFPITNNKKFTKKLVHSIEEVLKLNKSSNQFRLKGCPEIESVYCNFVEYEQPLWQLAQVYDVGKIDIDNLKNIIDQKKLKLESYKICDEQWLLVVIDFWNPAQDQEMNLIGDEIISNPFDKIFIYKPASVELIEFS